MTAFLNEIWNTDTAEIILKLTLAVLCGGVLGLERELKKRPAGFRTYILVCIGSALVVMINTYILELYQVGDPARMPAQVVSGIGFLGAGTIITTQHNRITGLTTAAGLWAAAGIGMALGIGFYIGALVGTALIFFTLSVMSATESRILTFSKYVVLYMEFEKMISLKNLLGVLKQYNIHLIDFEPEGISSERNAAFAAVVTLKVPSKKVHVSLPEIIVEAEGITYLEEL